MNKYKLIIILCFFSFLSFLPSCAKAINGLTLMGKTIVLDAGHGGVDAGAINGKIVEKDLNLVLTKKLEKQLISRGATVYLTRNDDRDLATSSVNRKRSDLYNRAKYINDISPDMYISLHLNSTSSPKWKGLQVFYNNKNSKNKIIADIITKELKMSISNVRDIKNNQSYYMYKFIDSPGVLIEMGFISNYDENYLLRKEEYQNKLAREVATSIEKYFENN